MRGPIVAAVLMLVSNNALAGWFDTQPEPTPVQISRFEGNDVYKSIQCDVGRFAQASRKQRLEIDPAMKAHVSYSASTEISIKASLSAELGVKIANILSGPGLSAEISNGRTQNDSLEDDFNVNSGNTGACFSSRPPVNVYECLITKSYALKTGRAHCDTQTVAAGKLSANGKFIVWYINFGPSFEYDVKRTYTISVDAPPKAK